MERAVGDGAAQEEVRAARAAADVDEVLGTGYFESFLALIRAPSEAKRLSLLKRAGAPTDIDERRLMLFEDAAATTDSGSESPIASGEEPKSAPAQGDEELAAKQPRGGVTAGQSKRVPLFAPAQIVVDGVPIKLFGTPAGPEDKQQRKQQDAPSGENGELGDGANGTGYGGHTDMDALDALGMAVTVAYEMIRLRKSGHADAQAFDSSSAGTQPYAFVFDVSTPAKIAKARASSPQFEKAFGRLVNDHGVSPEWPGFDVLTLAPGTGGEVDRLIELKSSGVSARIQEMSWNEWKSARSNALRHRFYLYLVGNLRADLDGAIPFVRTIRDPFEQLLAETQVSQRTERKVQFAVHLFREAEHLDLTVRRDGNETSEGSGQTVEHVNADISDVSAT